MTTLRVAKATIQVDHKFRAAKVTVQGTGTNPKCRVSHVLAQGPVPLNMHPIPDQTVEAYSTVTINVPSANTFPSGTSFAWRQISGPSVAYADNGTNITFPAPTAMGGAAVVFGVTAVNGGQSSTEATGTTNVQPHLYWQAVGGVWVPLTRKAAA